MKKSALALSICLGLFVQGAAGAEESLMEQVDASILGIQNHYTNASLKIRKGIVTEGAGKSGTPDDTPRTLVESCCQYNLEKIDGHIRSLATNFEKMYVHYAKENNGFAIDELELMRSNLKSVADGMHALRNSPTTPEATRALQGIIRPFNAMRESGQTLAQCCPIGGEPAPDSDPAGKAKAAEKKNP